MTEPSADSNSEPQEQPAHDASVNSSGSDSAADPIGEAAADTATPAHGSSSSNIMILWPESAERAAGSAPHTEERIGGTTNGRFSLRRTRRMALAAVAALAMICGAAGGSLATLALTQFGATPAAPAVAAADGTAHLKDMLARVSAEVGGLRVDLDHASHARNSQISKLVERLDKVEKSQDDTSGRLTKVSEVQDKLQEKLQDKTQEKAQDRIHTASLAAPAAADVTGSINPPVAAKGDLKPDAKKPPVVDGWTLNEITHGGAIVYGPGGFYEAYPGDPLPGLGRVDAVRYQDGRWVVVTAKGLIVRR